MSSLYERLGPANIRLLTVRSIDDVAATLDLRTYMRTEAPDYDAVSYAWGDDLSTTSVKCNGVLLMITTTLFRALHYLHNCRAEPMRPLWIDAICLNQKDPYEKADQVPLMGDVYENASRTLVWLGEAADNSDLAMKNIEGLAQMLLNVKNPNDTFVVRERLAEQHFLAFTCNVWGAHSMGPATV